MDTQKDLDADTHTWIWTNTWRDSEKDMDRDGQRQLDMDTHGQTHPPMDRYRQMDTQGYTDTHANTNIDKLLHGQTDTDGCRDRCINTGTPHPLQHSHMHTFRDTGNTKTLLDTRPDKHGHRHKGSRRHGLVDTQKQTPTWTCTWTCTRE